MSFRPMSDAEFARLEAKGRELFAAMVEGARSNEYVPLDVNAEDELDVNAEDELDVNSEDELDVNVTKIAMDVGVPVDGYVSAEVWNTTGPRRAMTGLLAIVRLTVVNITTYRLVDKIRKQYRTVR
ncbi:hypothetical protein NEMBOFW57_006950 [Staphylotrichum longicolle]|uniref:Uncharacterized protein n=1 Tax=Staphylotrichum longicolle TaxID=669026 RepID=A0AAD4EUA8_9PEZI|nr:hypothetical protein NEMBOFW57_006950 [Staphylotrichum longicolle]